MSKKIEEMTPGELIKVIRNKDLKTIRALTKIMIKEKNGRKLMSISELKNALEDNGVVVDAATISRWSNA